MAGKARTRVRDWMAGTGVDHVEAGADAEVDADAGDESGRVWEDRDMAAEVV